MSGWGLGYWPRLWGRHSSMHTPLCGAKPATCRVWDRVDRVSTFIESAIASDLGCFQDDIDQQLLIARRWSEVLPVWRLAGEGWRQRIRDKRGAQMACGGRHLGLWGGVGVRLTKIPR
jgi:hypothetical protein